MLVFDEGHHLKFGPLGCEVTDGILCIFSTGPDKVIHYFELSSFFGMLVHARIYESLFRHHKDHWKYAPCTNAASRKKQTGKFDLQA